MAASLTRISCSSAFTFSASKASVFSPSLSPPSIKVPTFSPLTVKTLGSSFAPHVTCAISLTTHATLTPSSVPSDTSTTTFHGLCYVVGDNIDTDQIIPAEYLTLVPSNPAEYEKLGSYALVGLPSSYTTRFIEPNETKTKYSIVIGGANFGCGSSREHAPVALGAAGAKAVVAESYARIFFRNSVATGEVYPLESEVRICEECKTGDVVTIQLRESRLINHSTCKEYKLNPIGDAGPVIEAGGIFAYARKTGMIPSESN
ncbi:3-isopropylmalate dehydratase small subunit 3 [Hibiscus syriacus]|uniref:3-isopropylmalate dehydratase n=1 Tax=Hibiscus syriacus TaxID=106335 RepID=A0A6A3BIG0_HIBSY|nr:3-isopropylmalate dehydratase small subunit 1-like [Hibiscus syriacus]KAE8716816.1 3-isopropylmalate dehydratase small subunit 3 [Hibiscus syriacus]